MALTQAELLKLNAHLRDDSQGGLHILAGAVAKVLLASPDPQKVHDSQPGSFLRRFPRMSPTAWTDTGLEGAITLVYDKLNCILSFQIFSLVNLGRNQVRCLFKYELYADFAYNKLSKQLHCFEIDDCIMGLLFSSVQQAAIFSGKLLEVTQQQSRPRLDNRSNSFTSFNQFAGTPYSSGLYSSGAGLSSPTPYSSAPLSMKSPYSNNFKSPSMPSNFLSPQPNKSGSVASQAPVPLPGLGSNFKVNTGPRGESGKKKKKKKGKKVKAKTNQNGSTRSFFGMKKKPRDGKLTRSIGSDNSANNSSMTGLVRWNVGRQNSQTSKNSSKTKNSQKATIIQPNDNVAKNKLGLNIDNSGLVTIDPNALSSQWKTTFKEAGIKKKDLQNPVVASAIYDTLQLQEIFWSYEEEAKHNPEMKGLTQEQLRQFALQNPEQYARYIHEMNEYDYKTEQYDNYQNAKQKLGNWEKTAKPIVRKRSTNKDKSYDHLLTHNQAMFDDSRASTLFEPSLSKAGNSNNGSFREMSSLDKFESLADGGRRRPQTSRDRPPAIPARTRNSPSPRELATKSDSSYRYHSGNSILPPPPPIESLDLKPPPSPPRRRPKLPTIDKTMIKFNSGNQTGPVAPIFLHDVTGQRQLNHVSGSDAYMQTMKRLKKKMATNPANQNTLVKRLQEAMVERRDIVEDDESSLNSDWS